MYASIVFRGIIELSELTIFDHTFSFLVEREHVQKKTFTKWVNSHLCRINCKVNDLYTDLRDGKNLLKLLEILSGERLVRI